MTSFLADLPHSATADAGRIFSMLEASDALRRPERFAGFLDVCTAHADVHGQPFNAELMTRALAAASEVQANQLSKDLEGPAVGAALREARIKAIEKLL